MGRKTKEKIELTEKRVYSYLLEREDTKNKLTALEQIFESFAKSRSSERKQKFRADMMNSFRVLCSQSTDLLEWKAKLKNARKASELNGRKRAGLADKILALERRNMELCKCETSLQLERDSKHRTEEAYGQLLDTNRELESKLSKLQTKFSKLEEENTALHKRNSLSTIKLSLSPGSATTT